MTILCGIDFSEASSHASEIAADIARRLKTPLTLVHAVNPMPRELEGGRSPDEVLASAQRAMEKRASALIERGAKVSCRTEFGTADQLLSDLGLESHASMVVLSSTGKGHSVHRPLGTMADRLAQASRLPSLTLRSPLPFAAWLKGERPLKVVVGLDFGQSSQEAWRWAKDLSQIAPIELVGAHVYWPPEEIARLGLHGPRHFIEPDVEVEKVIGLELERHYPREALVSARFRLQPAMARPSDNLLAVASSEKADLVVVGTRVRGALAHLWEGSASHQVLKAARCAVACVPLASALRCEDGRSIGSVLVATDFSELGNSAIPYALSQVGAGGRVYLVHVADDMTRGLPAGDLFTFPESHGQEQRLLEDRLRGLVPVRAFLRDVRVETKIIRCREAADGIVQAAERLGAEVICLGTHGRTGLHKALVGSVAEAVLHRTHRPVLLVRAPRG
jgi:nucleotide-binding universal stress UspA family protein